MKTSNTPSTARRILAAALLSGGLAAMPVHAGGIPVIDGAALTQNMQQAMQRYMQMAEQIKNQVEQIEQLKKQVESLQGNRNMGNLLRNQAQEQLPEEWKKVYSAAQQLNNKDLLSSKGYNADADNQRLSKQFDLTIRAIKDSEIRMKNINALMDQINQTKDIKAAADLQNRIAAEQAVIQQNQTNLDMMERLMALQEKVQAKKRAERDNCRLRNRIDGTNKSCG